MKKSNRIAVVAAALLLLSLAFAGEAGAWRVWVGPGWVPGPFYYPPYYAYPQPPVVVQQPNVYLQQPSAPQEQTYWYYCKDSQAYYPYVKECPSGWMKVVPSPPAQPASPAAPASPEAPASPDAP